MKKLLFAALLAVTFSGSVIAGTKEVQEEADLIPPDNCTTAAFVAASLVEEDSESAGLGCLTSSQWNAVYNAAYNDCKAQ